MVLIKRDGETVAEVEDGNAAYAWMHRHHSYSMAHALRYEGYTITDEAGRVLPDFADYRKV